MKPQIVDEPTLIEKPPLVVAHAPDVPLVDEPVLIDELPLDIAHAPDVHLVDEIILIQEVPLDVTHAPDVHPVDEIILIDELPLDIAAPIDDPKESIAEEPKKLDDVILQDEKPIEVPIDSQVPRKEYAVINDFDGERIEMIRYYKNTKVDSVDAPIEVIAEQPEKKDDVIQDEKKVEEHTESQILVDTTVSEAHSVDYLVDVIPEKVDEKVEEKIDVSKERLRHYSVVAEKTKKPCKSCNKPTPKVIKKSSKNSRNALKKNAAKSQKRACTCRPRH